MAKAARKKLNAKPKSRAKLNKRKATKKSKPAKLPYKEVSNPEKVTQAEAATGPVTLPDNDLVHSALPTDASRDVDDTDYDPFDHEIDDDIDEGLF